MSDSHAHGAAQAEEFDDRHVHGHHEGESTHGSFREYVIGFLLSVVLTAIPFWLVMAKVIPSKQATIWIVLAFAVVQILVHMVYFLHLNTRSEGGWNMLALIFTLVLVVIALTGSLWVMYHMNQNMTPMSAQDVRNMP
ncbi:MAG: cytochrome o ubiquinol oxidase subunit IV [Lysobacter sp.]|nr:cytochrome o ubiquinol oxidase subunit IV [Lysobacter sp.]